jgi:hypothetical protein
VLALLLQSLVHGAEPVEPAIQFIDVLAALVQQIFQPLAIDHLGAQFGIHS